MESFGCIKESCMKVLFGPQFHKKLKLLSHAEQRMVKEQTELFLKDSTNSALQDHRLTGNMSIYSSFSVHDDLRVIYRIVSNECVKFVDVGPHSKVYK